MYSLLFPTKGGSISSIRTMSCTFNHSMGNNTQVLLPHSSKKFQRYLNKTNLSSNIWRILLWIVMHDSYVHKIITTITIIIITNIGVNEHNRTNLENCWNTLSMTITDCNYNSFSSESIQFIEWVTVYRICCLGSKFGWRNWGNFKNKRTQLNNIQHREFL